MADLEGGAPVPPTPRPISEPETAPASPLTSLNNSDPITLRVGERNFVTALATLTGESQFFSSMFSGNWHNTKQPDGSYFIDADPDLFAHILRYLRHNMLPLFYANGHHDLGLYAALLGEAKYFQIPSLVKWLEHETYFRAVKVQRDVDEAENVLDLRDLTKSNEEVEYHPFRTTEKVYVCPRGISLHRGRPNACGRLCQRARGDDPEEYEDEDVYKALVIRKTVVFDHRLCAGDE
ncbi:hypothetical protein EPUS_03673 [Endocarpon pusillum Z07020]|uniref:BTB domain-containing protein n=1 Tax=Endocarpon pusillum (strain Z07020 / HMAS-L-300199) TaxID=1263415 RepID=U1GDB2_ENDPU|nr:uncharacterized protein EPUS_03673 [Endocarpon pusillum Z07020]ERF69681.1 hypothetical protein EPUS_03673 [Endocarpon pusillum Z07020]